VGTEGWEQATIASSTHLVVLVVAIGRRRQVYES
jgi:hypothetical protein